MPFDSCEPGIYAAYFQMQGSLIWSIMARLHFWQVSQHQKKTTKLNSKKNRLQQI